MALGEGSGPVRWLYPWALQLLTLQLLLLSFLQLPLFLPPSLQLLVFGLLLYMLVRLLPPV